MTFRGRHSLRKIGFLFGRPLLVKDARPSSRIISRSTTTNGASSSRITAAYASKCTGSRHRHR